MFSSGKIGLYRGPLSGGNVYTWLLCIRSQQVYMNQGRQLLIATGRRMARMFIHDKPLKYFCKGLYFICIKL